MEADVIVIGSGAAGMTAAIVAAKAGLEVMLLEKTQYFGGTTAYSGGAVWIPNNHYQHEAGIDDGSGKAEQYLRSVVGNLYDANKISTFLRNAPEMLSYMEANTEVKFMPVQGPDYEPHLDGAGTGRTLLSSTYEAGTLGQNLRRLRPSLPQLSVFGTMQFGPMDLPYFLNMHRSVGAFAYSAKQFFKFVKDKAKYGRGARLSNGNALAGRLLRSALMAGVNLRANAQVKELIVEQDFASGVIAEMDGIKVRVLARKGVILATGGFGANAALRAKHVPMANDGPSLQPEGNQGDGIEMGIGAGGVFRTDNIANGIWVPVSSMRLKDGRRINFPHLFFDRHSPGTLVVDKSGRRFINEATHYQNFGNMMHAEGITSAFLISDHPAYRKYGMGLAKPFPYPIAPFIRSGYLTKGETIRELARKIGVDETAVEKTVTDFNRNAADGLDPVFHRGHDPYSSYMGDPGHGPNPCLAPLKKGPFYAIELRPGDLSTLCGLDTNENAQVLGKDGKVIDGLYAVGLDMNTVFRGTYPGGGASLGPAMTFGYVAARHIVDK